MMESDEKRKDFIQNPEKKIMQTGMETKIYKKLFSYIWKLKVKHSFSKINKSVQESGVSNSPNWERGDLQWTAVWKGGVACWTSKGDQSRGTD